MIEKNKLIINKKEMIRAMQVYVDKIFFMEEARVLTVEKNGQEYEILIEGKPVSSTKKLLKKLEGKLEDKLKC